MKYLSLLLIFISVQLHALTFKSDGTVIKSDGTVIESTKELSTSNSSSSGKGCSARGDITDPVIAPLWENYQREYSDSRIDTILSNRRTINVFLPWHDTKIYNLNKDFRMHWSFSITKHLVPNYLKEKILTLTTLHWNYQYKNRNKDLFYFPNKFEYVLNKKWNHASDWGETYWVDYFSDEYAEDLSNAIFKIEERGHLGVFFDWWHNNHYDTQPKLVSDARLRIIKKIKEKVSDDFLIMGNTNYFLDLDTHDYINSVFLELIAETKVNDSFFRLPKVHSCKEIQEMEKIIKIHDEKLQYPKVIAFEPRTIRNLNNKIYNELNKYDTGMISDDDLKNKMNEDLLTLENISRAKLFTAMGAIIPEHGYILYADNFGDNPVGNHRFYYYDFYDIDMGKPISLMTSIIEGVAYKKYERGIIAYNRLPIAVAVKFPSGRVENLEAYSGNFFWDDPQEELENQKLLYN